MLNALQLSDRAAGSVATSGLFSPANVVSDKLGNKVQHREQQTVFGNRSEWRRTLEKY